MKLLALGMFLVAVISLYIFFNFLNFLLGILEPLVSSSPGDAP